MQNLVVVSHTVRSHAGGHKNWGTLGPRLLGWGVADPLKHDTPHSCYHTKYGRWSMSFGSLLLHPHVLS